MPICNCHNCRFVQPVLIGLLERVVNGEETVIIRTDLEEEIKKTLGQMYER